MRSGMADLPKAMFKPITEEFLLELYTISTSSKLVSLSFKISAVASNAGGM